jgi:arsenate reductase-like glutaredoxin family protein
MASLFRRRGIDKDDIMKISKSLDEYPNSLFSSKGTESDERNTKASETKEQETNESILEGTKAKIRW